MQEPNIMGGLKRYLVENSGPGPVYYMGDEEAGYFGEVPQEQVITNAEFKTKYPFLTSYNALWENEPFLKYWWRGKILFIKKKPTFITTWSALYAAGLIYGPDGPQNEAPLIDAEQTTILDKSGHRYFVRTMTGDEFDVTTIMPRKSSTWASDVTPRRVSMFTELIYRSHPGVVAAYPEDKFKNSPNGVIMAHTTVSPYAEIMREIAPSARFVGQWGPLTRRWEPVLGDLNTQFASTRLGDDALSTKNAWRMVLELVPSGNPTPVYQFMHEVTAEATNGNSSLGGFEVEDDADIPWAVTAILNKSVGPNHPVVDSNDFQALGALRTITVTHLNAGSHVGFTGEFIEEVIQ